MRQRKSAKSLKTGTKTGDSEWVAVLRIITKKAVRRLDVWERLSGGSCSNRLIKYNYKMGKLKTVGIVLAILTSAEAQIARADFQCKSSGLRARCILGVQCKANVQVDCDGIEGFVALTVDEEDKLTQSHDGKDFLAFSHPIDIYSDPRGKDSSGRDLQPIHYAGPPTGSSGIKCEWESKAIYANSSDQFCGPKGANPIGYCSGMVTCTNKVGVKTTSTVLCLADLGVDNPDQIEHCPPAISCLESKVFKSSDSRLASTQGKIQYQSYDGSMKTVSANALDSKLFSAPYGSNSVACSRPICVEAVKTEPVNAGIDGSISKTFLVMCLAQNDQGNFSCPAMRQCGDDEIFNDFDTVYKQFVRGLDKGTPKGPSPTGAGRAE